jgi:GNAT superfamily N-acetyltransferase
MPYTRPEPLTSAHVLDGFQCQHASLSDWLVKRALANQNNLASKTFVVTDGERVVGYYALASGSVALESAPGAIRRNMPAPVPAIVLGRLAVDERHQGQSLGRGLLRDATLRAIGAAETVAARVLLCHAIDEAAKAFYIGNGFLASPVDPLMVMLDLKKALAIAAS